MAAFFRFVRGKRVNGQTSCFFQTFLQTPSVHSTKLPHVTILFHHLNFSSKSSRDPLFYIEDTVRELLPADSGLIQTVKSAELLLPSVSQALDFLRNSGVKLECDLVKSAIWGLRDEWKLAFLVFKWGEECCNCCRDDEKVWRLMIWVLGSCRKFNVAWSLVRDLYRSKMDARCSMLIMIERYAANGYTGKAIRTFQLMEKLNLSADTEAFYDLLRFLCAHGSVEEAEDFMLCNKTLFPLTTESFNIILDGWCNLCDVTEAKRVWREMSRYCVMPNESTYTHLIRCFSDAGNMFDALRLYDGMQNKGWTPGCDVYNSLMYVLTLSNCLKEALKMMEKMRESGCPVDSCSFNSLLRPLCETYKISEARIIMCIMIRRHIQLDKESYHAILISTNYEGALKVLDRMWKANYGPNADTFLILIDNFLGLGEPKSAVKILELMRLYNVSLDFEHYQTLIHGLAACGWLDKAKEVYSEMKTNGIRDDPKLKLLLKLPKGEKNRIKNNLK